MNAPQVVIVGGGITGMAAAYYLERLSEAAGEPIDILLVERSPRLGGKVGTERFEGCLLDTGPDSFLAQKPWALELCRELGLGDEIISPLARQFYILLEGRLHKVPHELVALVPNKPEALWEASFLSLAGKMRASSEALIKPDHDLEDESLSSFMRRRFGEEFALRFAEPLMGGVHAGDPDRMSMAAIYPMYWQMEKKQGSISRALLERRLAAARHGAAPPPGSPFVALRNGMISLIERLEQRLTRTRILTGTGVESLSPLADGAFRVALSDGAEAIADSLIVTAPAFHTAQLVRPFAPDAATLLDQIPYTSSAIVTLAYRKETIRRPLEGTGFLVPRDQPLSITGCTWSSNKWAGRAPDDIALMRVFIGQAGADALVMDHTEEELAALAHDEIAGLLDLEAPPLFSRVYRQIHAMPQYEVGHLGRMQRVDASLNHTPALLLAGSAFRGVGLPDCIRQGKEAAEQSLKRLTDRERTQVLQLGGRA